MKRKTIPRGLYQKVEEKPAPGLESLNWLLSMANELDSYLDRKEAMANKILTDHGIEPNTLWNLIAKDDEQNRRSQQKYRYQQIDFEDHGYLAAQAFEVLEAVRNIRFSSYADSTNPSGRNALVLGIRLAQHAEHLVANLAFEKPVNARKRQTAGLLKNPPRPRPATKAQRIRELADNFPDDCHRAEKIAKQAGCTARYVRRVLKEP